VTDRTEGPTALPRSPRPHGALPPWGVTALPPAPTFTVRNVLATIGPGLIGLGVAVGSGEWLLGPSIVVRYGPALLWITTVSVLLQVFLNMEMCRYTMYTGEPMFVGYMRTRPGPVFWGWLYGLLSFLQYGWPGWALASATALAAVALGRAPADADRGLVIAFGYVTFALCFVIVCSGRKVVRTIEWAMWAMKGCTFIYLLGIALFTVSAGNWATILRGFMSVGTMPSGADWLLLGAFAAYSGLGGVGNAFITNWMRDKGYGMGATVGHIPSAFGEGTDLAPHGNVFEPSRDNLGRWSAWWKFLNVDQWLVFATGSLLGMVLTTLMTIEYVPRGTEIGPWAVANMQADAIAREHGAIFRTLTLMIGFWVLFSTQLGLVDGLPRAVTDILWSSGRRSGRRVKDVRVVYYSVLALFAVWGCVAMNLAQPLTLVIISANVAGFAFVIEAVHTLVVNRKFLPRELRPPFWRECLIVCCVIFYGAFIVTTVAMSLG
jgi:hypothetical protein